MMRAHLAALLAVTLAAVSAPLAAAQGISALLLATPQCATPCLFQGLQDGNCSLAAPSTIPNCACTNLTLQATLSACVQQSCNVTDQIKAAGLLGELCAAFPKESRGFEVKLTAVVCLALTAFIVLLRCIARWTVSSRLWLDDWTALLATVLLIALCSVKIVGASLGFGLHYWNVQPANAAPIFQIFYTAQILYILIQVAAKVSILVLFGRIFTATWLRRSVLACNIFVVGHGLIFIIIVILQCIPVQAVWERGIQAKCLNITAVTWAGAILSIVEDLVILFLPVREVFRLQLTLQKKIAVVLMFSIGSFACVTSMVRLKYIVSFTNSFDSTWDNVDVVTWSIIEVACAIICGSLPTLRPLLQKVPGLLSSVKTTSQANTGSNNMNSSQKRAQSAAGHSRSNSRPLRHSPSAFQKLNEEAWAGAAAKEQGFQQQPTKPPYTTAAIRPRGDSATSLAGRGRDEYEMEPWTPTSDGDQKSKRLFRV
ncbi:hypothetical protein RB597_003997 [Gaeumannomyces tritici]